MSTVSFGEQIHDTFMASVRSVGTACTLAAVGTYMHQRGLISVQGKRMLALISQQVTFPLFLFTKIVNCNQDWSVQQCPSVTQSLRQVWMLVFWPLFVVGMGLLVGRFVSQLCQTPLQQHKIVMAAIAFSNSTGLPITLLTVVHSNFSKTSELGRIDPTLFLSVYLLLYPVLQWGLGGWLLAPDQKDKGDDDEEEDEDIERQQQQGTRPLLMQEAERNEAKDNDVDTLGTKSVNYNLGPPLISIITTTTATTEPMPSSSVMMGATAHNQAHEHHRSSLYSVPSTLKLNVLNNRSDDQQYIRRRQGLYSTDEGMYLSDFNLSAMASQSQADLDLPQKYAYYSQQMLQQQQQPLSSSSPTLPPSQQQQQPLLSSPVQYGLSLSPSATHSFLYNMAPPTTPPTLSSSPTALSSIAASAIPAVNHGQLPSTVASPNGTGGMVLHSFLPPEAAATTGPKTTTTAATFHTSQSAPDFLLYDSSESTQVASYTAASFSNSISETTTTNCINDVLQPPPANLSSSEQHPLLSKMVQTAGAPPLATLPEQPSKQLEKINTYGSTATDALIAITNPEMNSTALEKREPVQTTRKREASATIGGNNINNNIDHSQNHDDSHKFKGESLVSTIQTVLERCFQPPVVGAVAGIVVAIITPVRGLFVDVVDRDGDAPMEWLFDGLYSVGLTAVPINMIILGCNLSSSYNKFMATSSSRQSSPSSETAILAVDKKKNQENTGGTTMSNSLSMTTLIGIVIGKMIVMPIIGFASVLILQNYVLDIPHDIDAPFYLVLLIVFLTPTANNVMVMVELSGSNTKEGIANVIAMQYAVAPIILSCTMTLAIGYARSFS